MTSVEFSKAGCPPSWVGLVQSGDGLECVWGWEGLTGKTGTAPTSVPLWPAPPERGTCLSSINTRSRRFCSGFSQKGRAPPSSTGSWKSL